ncbi:MAG: hypothetical protein K1Y36_03355 [Blastocatellia bacterium]|nr:hypothetical protein [Blastocatellia bacterium]
MALDSRPACVRWQIHLSSPPQEIFRLLATNQGNLCSCTTISSEGICFLEFHLPLSQPWQVRLIETTPPSRISLEYSEGSLATFDLNDDGTGGTDLTLTDFAIPAEERLDVIAKWVSVLLALQTETQQGFKVNGPVSVNGQTHKPAC